MKINFEKNILTDYIRENEGNKLEINAAYNLYKKYNLINKITENRAHEIVNFLDKLEDKIYTINGRKLPNITRLHLELSLIKNKCETVKYLDESILIQMQLIENLINDLGTNNYEKTFEIKKQICILQAKLGIEPSFIYASYCAFEDVYKNILIERATKDIKNKR